MQGRQSLLFFVKLSHTAVFFVETAAILYIVYCGMLGIQNFALGVAMGLVILESVIYIGSGLHCPMTAWAKSLGDNRGDDFIADIFLPEWFVPLVPRICGTIAFIGMFLVAAQILL